jgi:hypothetical protein
MATFETNSRSDQSTDTTFEVGIAWPGSAAWCNEIHASIDDWIGRLASSPEASALEIMPSFRVAADPDDEFAELLMEWTLVPGSEPWEAVENAASIARLIAPFLFDGAALRTWVAPSGVPVD